MSEHTKGRLAVDGHCLVNVDGDLVAECADTRMESDARRLVACWNACEQATTEQLESAANDKRHRHEILSDLIQRNKDCYDLIEALRAVMPFIDDADDVQQLFPESAASKPCREAVAAVRALLAKHTPKMGEE